MQCSQKEGCFESLNLVVAAALPACRPQGIRARTPSEASPVKGAGDSQTSLQI